jgi:hypothetical protein
VHITSSQMEVLYVPNCPNHAVALERLREILSAEILSNLRLRVSPKTIRNVKATVSLMWRIAKAWGYMEEDVSSGLDLPQVPRSKQPYLTATQTGRIFRIDTELQATFYWLTSIRIPSPFVNHLKRDANCNPGAVRIPTVIQVIPVIEVLDINIVRLVPVVSPVFWIRINGTEPIATVLEARIPANLHEGEAVDAERVIPTIVATEIVVRNTVAVVAAALRPSAVLGVPALSTTLLPGAPLFAFLFTLLLLRAL